MGIQYLLENNDSSQNIIVKFEHGRAIRFQIRNMSDILDIHIRHWDRFLTIVKLTHQRENWQIEGFPNVLLNVLRQLASYVWPK